jgi:PIN domain nuclease of toxin-antitoxin system
MRLLLDTHALLWFALDHPNLSAAAQSLILDPANEKLISPATYWEIAIKFSRGKLDFSQPYAEFMADAIDGNGFGILPVLVPHTTVVSTLPFHHRDPFDRLLVAQALAENVPIVSADTALDPYGVRRLW